jgi:predicted amidophosphoribosyltransferase
MENYNCPDCGADNTFLPKDCCDTCILKFFVEDETQPSLTDIDPR